MEEGFGFRTCAWRFVGAYHPNRLMIVVASTYECQVKFRAERGVGGGAFLGKVGFLGLTAAA